MQSGSSMLQQALREALNLYARPRIIAEWNQNHYSEILAIDNNGYPEAVNAYDNVQFPIESIAQPVRPTAGIMKGITSEGIVTSKYSDAPGAYRTYTVSPDSKYKYWLSPTKSSSTFDAGNGGYPISNVSPQITYNQVVWTNKIYLCFESSYVKPVKYSVAVTYDGSIWTTIANNMTINSSGQAVIYLQANNSWSTTVYRNNAVQIRGVRVTATHLNQPDTHMHLIEVSPRLENDLTDFLISYDVSNDLSDVDFISPMGVISSNEGSVTLSNVDGRFNNDNSASLYAGLLDANVRFIIDLGFDISTWGGSGYEYIRLATMYSEVWGDGESEVTVPLKDASKFLQEVECPEIMILDASIGQAIWRLLDAVGFNSYQYTTKADQSVTRIPYFWTDPTKTVWTTIQELCHTTQSAAYFDEYGVLQIKTREAAFNKTAPVAWTLDGEANGSKKADIVELAQTRLYEANSVKVKYKPTGLAVDDQRNPISEIVWQPDGDVVLRAASLAQSMNSSQMYFYVSSQNATTWPYSGMVNIGGELIKYEGKEYKYRDSGGAWVYITLKSAEDKLNIDKSVSNQLYSYQNAFTGKFVVTERGVDMTTAIAHDVNIANWMVGKRYSNTSYATADSGYVKHLKDQSILRLACSSTFDKYDLSYSVQNNANYGSITPYSCIHGTRLRFPSEPHGTRYEAGLYFYGSSDERYKYILSVKSTAEIDRFGERASRNEVKILKKTNTGYHNLSPVHIGSPLAVTTDQWIDIDVQVSNHTFTVFVNGVYAFAVTDTSYRIGYSSRAGVWTDGYTVADFEYFYSMDLNAGPEITSDNSSFLDLIRGDYVSRQYSTVLYPARFSGTRFAIRRADLYKVNYAKRVFDEFGIQVHEVRPYTVKFEKTPVLYSSLYLSNTDQAVVEEYVHSPFGASFIVANAYRVNAVLNGEDTLTFGADNPVDQKMVITGRTVQQKDEQEYVVKNESAIRARGENSLDISSDWLQSEAAAKALGDWIVNNWADPADEAEVEVFVNPLLQVTDIVSINYALKDMTAATHKYFVTRIRHGWDDGPTTSVTLRRARI